MDDVAVAAVYARKSTDQSMVTEDARSVTRQIANARAFAAQRGWHIADEHIYVDDGISGAEFQNRPALVRLLAALTPKPPFTILLTADRSRIGREAVETAFVLKQLLTSGVAVHYCLTGEQETLSDPTAKLLMAVGAFADEMERAKAALRVRDALLRKARAGFVTGGRVFGYDNVEVRGADDKRSHVERRINHREAQVVRRIFQLCADGHGLAAIARTLNEQGASCPRPQQGRVAGWCPSSVRPILRRRIYIGELVWNQTAKRDEWGQRRPRPRPASEHITVAVPDLRIVNDDLWAAAHAALDGARDRYLRGTGGRLWGRSRGADSKFLLTGFGACHVCGGPLQVETRAHGTLRRVRVRSSPAASTSARADPAVRTTRLSRCGRRMRRSSTPSPGRYCARTSSTPPSTAPWTGCSPGAATTTNSARGCRRGSMRLTARWRT